MKLIINFLITFYKKNLFNNGNELDGKYVSRTPYKVYPRIITDIF
jgi:hypothetical protein